MTSVRARASRHHVLLTLLAFGLFWLPVILFARIAAEVIEREPLAIDSAIISVVSADHTSLLTHFFLFVTSLGEPLVVGGTALILIIGLLWLRRWRGAAAVAAGVGGAVLANLLLKTVFARARPDEIGAILTEHSYSFPSGHSMVSAAFVTILIVLVWRTRLRLPALIGGIAVSGLIGLSRIYLGVHYPSDVFAGWCLGIVWALIVGSLLLNRPFRLGHLLTPLHLRG